MTNQELIELIADLSQRLAQHQRGKTHWDGCEVGHNDCALLKRAEEVIRAASEPGAARGRITSTCFDCNVRLEVSYCGERVDFYKLEGWTLGPPLRCPDCTAKKLAARSYCTEDFKCSYCKGDTQEPPPQRWGACLSDKSDDRPVCSVCEAPNTRGKLLPNGHCTACEIL